MKMDYREQIIDFLSEKYGWEKDKIFTTTNFQELGLDSLSLYSIITDIEEMLDIKIDTNDITEINSPIKLINYVEKVKFEKI